MVSDPKIFKHEAIANFDFQFFNDDTWTDKSLIFS